MKCHYNKYMREYRFKRYHTDIKFKKNHLESVSKYGKTPKGKDASVKSCKKLRERGYYKKYFKKRRIEARKKGLCTSCLIRKALKNYMKCKKCRENRKYWEAKNV